MRPPTTPARRLLTLAALILFGAGTLAGCGSEGADTDCSLSRCTITFDRGVDASTSVLGVEVALEEASDGEVTVSVAGRTATVPVEGSREVAGLTVEARSVTEDEVVVQVSR